MLGVGCSRKRGCAGSWPTPACSPASPAPHHPLSTIHQGWEEAAKQYDATELVKQYSGPALPVLLDTGGADEFLQTQVGWVVGMGGWAGECGWVSVGAGGRVALGREGGK